MRAKLAFAIILMLSISAMAASAQPLVDETAKKTVEKAGQNRNLLGMLLYEECDTADEQKLSGWSLGDTYSMLKAEITKIETEGGTFKEAIREIQNQWSSDETPEEDYWTIKYTDKSGTDKTKLLNLGAKMRRFTQELNGQPKNRPPVGLMEMQRTLSDPSGVSKSMQDAQNSPVYVGASWRPGEKAQINIKAGTPKQGTATLTMQGGIAQLAVSTVGGAKVILNFNKGQITGTSLGYNPTGGSLANIGIGTIITNALLRTTNTRQGTRKEFTLNFQSNGRNYAVTYLNHQGAYYPTKVTVAYSDLTLETSLGLAFKNNGMMLSGGRFVSRKGDGTELLIDYNSPVPENSDERNPTTAVVSYSSLKDNLERVSAAWNLDGTKLSGTPHINLFYNDKKGTYATLDLGKNKGGTKYTVTGLSATYDFDLARSAELERRRLEQQAAAASQTGFGAEEGMMPATEELPAPSTPPAIKKMTISLALQDNGEYAVSSETNFRIYMQSGSSREEDQVTLALDKLPKEGITLNKKTYASIALLITRNLRNPELNYKEPKLAEAVARMGGKQAVQDIISDTLQAALDSKRVNANEVVAHAENIYAAAAGPNAPPFISLMQAKESEVLTQRETGIAGCVIKKAAGDQVDPELECLLKQKEALRQMLPKSKQDIVAYDYRIEEMSTDYQKVLIGYSSKMRGNFVKDYEATKLNKGGVKKQIPQGTANTIGYEDSYCNGEFARMSFQMTSKAKGEQGVVGMFIGDQFLEGEPLQKGDQVA